MNLNISALLMEGFLVQNKLVVDNLHEKNFFFLNLGDVVYNVP